MSDPLFWSGVLFGAAVVNGVWSIWAYYSAKHVRALIKIVERYQKEARDGK